MQSLSFCDLLGYAFAVLYKLPQSIVVLDALTRSGAVAWEVVVITAGSAAAAGTALVVWVKKAAEGNHSSAAQPATKVSTLVPQYPAVAARPVNAKTINAWIEERVTAPQSPLVLGEAYTLKCQVGRSVFHNLLQLHGAAGVVPPSDIPPGGLETMWVLDSRTVEFQADSPEVTIVRGPSGGTVSWSALFPMRVPQHGESNIVAVKIIPRSVDEPTISVSIHANDRLYRQTVIDLTVDERARWSAPGQRQAAIVRDECAYSRGDQLDARVAASWQDPPGRLEIHVTNPEVAWATGAIPTRPAALQPRERSRRRLDHHKTTWSASSDELLGAIRNARRSYTRSGR